MSNDIISIFMPTFSRFQSGMLDQAIRSVLNQTYRSFELFVVDDASVDGSRELIQKYVSKDHRVKHVRMPRNIGQPALTMGLAYKQAKGRYVAFVYDDCIVYPQFLGTLLAKLKAEPDLGMVYGQIYLHWSDGNKQLLGSSYDHVRMDAGNNHIPNVGVMLRKDVIETVGWYDPHVLLSRFYDWDLWRRIAKHYRIGFIPQVIAEEFGASLDDAIGHTFTVFPDLLLKYANTDRDRMLLPTNLPHYDPYRLQFLEKGWTPLEAEKVYFLLMENFIKTFNINGMILYMSKAEQWIPHAVNKFTRKKIEAKNKQMNGKYHLLLEAFHYYLDGRSRFLDDDE